MREGPLSAKAPRRGQCSWWAGGGGAGLLLGPRAGHMEGVPVFFIVSVVSLLQDWEWQAAATVPGRAGCGDRGVGIIHFSQTQALGLN